MIDFLNLKQITALHADEIHQAASRVIDSGWYLKGIETQQFEEAYARYIGTRYCIGVANGLDALTLIFRAYLEMGLMMPGDEVIVPANTYIASILSVSECGLTPVLVEPRLDTLEIDDSLIEEAITPRTRAVMIVHLYGRCAYTERIAVLCQQHGLKLIEDNAQAHGCIVPAVRYDAMLHPQKAVSPSNAVRYDATSLHPQKTGSLGDAAGHSFYPGKNLGALGDAGAVTTNDDQLAAVVRSIANYGSSRKYVFDYCGRNSRIDELQAAILSVKLRHLDDDNRHRQQIAAYYYDHIQHPEVALPARLPDAQNVYHLFPILCEQRDALQTYLTEHGIQTLIHYPIPPHQQECYREYKHLSLPVTEQIHRQELSLPISPVMTMDEARQVVDAVNSFLPSAS
jgi:dTDP-4-amino-4,6-dideoxygalactose transaminase